MSQSSTLATSPKGYPQTFFFYRPDCWRHNQMTFINLVSTFNHIYQPLRSGRIWHKVNSSSSSSSCRAASTDIPDPLFPHISLSFIAFGRSSGLHPESSYSCCMYVRAGRPAFDWPYAGVQRSTSLTSSSLLLQQCPACLVRLACVVFVTGGRWSYSCCLVGCCCQELSEV